MLILYNYKSYIIKQKNIKLISFCKKKKPKNTCLDKR